MKAVGLESVMSHSLATKNRCSMLGCHVAEAENACILVSLSTSSIASMFAALADNFQSKVVMALVPVSSVAAFFDGDAELIASAVRSL